MEQIGLERLQQLLDEKKTFIVDFFAYWCGPCMTLGKTLEEIEKTGAQKYSGKIVFAKCNVEDEVELTERFQIRNVPTMLLFKDGALCKRIGCALPKDKLEDELMDLIMG